MHPEVRALEEENERLKLLKTHELSMTHQQVADELGTAREVVSRLIKQLA